MSRKAIMNTSDQAIVSQGVAKDLRQLASLGVCLLEIPKKGIVVQKQQHLHW